MEPIEDVKPVQARPKDNPPGVGETVDIEV